MNRFSPLIVVAGLGLCHPQSHAQFTVDLGTAQLLLDQEGRVERLQFEDGTYWPGHGRPAFLLQPAGGAALSPRSLAPDGDRLAVDFEDGSRAVFSVAAGRGYALLRLVELKTAQPLEKVVLLQLDAPAGARLRSVLNAATEGDHTAALLPCEVNVQALLQQSAATRADRQGCSHLFQPSDQAKQGKTAASFTATCDDVPSGWSMRGRSINPSLDLTGLAGIRAWIHGDGQGQSLKIQFYDGAGGYRDHYIPIDFQGWRQVTLTESPLDNLRRDRVSTINFYYNGMPAGKTVRCLIDQVEAILSRDGKEQIITIEDFESKESELWNSAHTRLAAQVLREHGLLPAAMALVACHEADFFETVSRMEQPSGLPSPRPGGAWNKISPWVSRSYLFLTNFRESQFEEALALAKRGGFSMILLGQESWCSSTGHYEVSQERFPNGLDGLRRTVERFHNEGFQVGLHLLAASIDSSDPYLTPVPDSRLVKGATATLAADVDEKAGLLTVSALPQGFPEEDGGYEGSGTILQLGDELIRYGRRSSNPPFGFKNCQRGYLGTKPAPHPKGEPVRHLVRSYGYHMFDMDTTLLDEVAANFARVANACAIDMIYFDGSERLQGDHWYYNAKLHKAFFDKLQDKNMLLQASSFSPYSWHLLARSASADGHGDLKGYLDERSPGFDYLAREGMPLDIGWYYGYDPNATLDQFEYVLGATLGYSSSMSFQVSVEAAARHPFTTSILDAIRSYENLRLSGKVPEDMRQRLRIDPALGGKRDDQEREKLWSQRREYRLVGGEGNKSFQRIVYGPWWDPAAAEAETTLTLADPGRGGFWVHMRPGPWIKPGPAYTATDALSLEAFEELSPYAGDASKLGVRLVENGPHAAVLPGVTQRLELQDGGPAGGAFAEYSASSDRPAPDGWSVLGREFQPPLDLSQHAGIGLWLRGDSHGGLFKLQLRDNQNAMDYYIANDYSGWRYHQLPRPASDAIDYSSVKSLLIYYNGLPARTAVKCGIDGIKALRQLEKPALADPWIAINGQKIAWNGSLAEGEYLVVQPEGTAQIFAPGAEPRHAGSIQTVEIPAGTIRVQFGAAVMLGCQPRFRLAETIPGQ